MEMALNVELELMCTCCLERVATKTRLIQNLKTETGRVLLYEIQKEGDEDGNPSMIARLVLKIVPADTPAPSVTESPSVPTVPKAKGGRFPVRAKKCECGGVISD
jgi:hypothetical protein